MEPKKKAVTLGLEEEKMGTSVVETLGATEQQYLIALTMIDKVGPKTCRSLLQHFGGAEGVFRAKKKDLMRIPYVGDKIAASIASEECLRNAEREIAFANRNKVKIVGWGDERYPRKLREVDDSPLVLYCAGEIPNADRPHIAVVGTRTPSGYGRRLAADFASYFAKLGIAVVSGLAFGIDMEAHAATMAAGGCTLAVLGHGLDQIYPREHTMKASQIVGTGGALLTEFSFRTQPEAFNFPARNRIISGLCDAVLVVEATEKGGALITAKMAFEQNREVFAIPGNLGVSTSVGCNRLIRDHIAKIACGPQDVIDGLQHLLRYRPVANKDQGTNAPLQVSDRERCVINALESGPLDFEELAEVAAIDHKDLRSILLALEFRKIISNAPGNKFKVGV